MNEIKVVVNFANKQCRTYAHELTNGDYNSTKLVFEFDKQDGRKVFEMKSPNGELVLLTDITNNEIVLVGKDENGNNASLFNQEGRYIFEISLYDGDSKLSSASSYLNVKQEAVIVDGEVITPYLPIFDELVSDVENLKKMINSGVGTITDVQVDGVSVVSDGVAKISLYALEQTLQDILTIIQGGQLDEYTVGKIEELIVSYFENKTIGEVER